MNKTENKIPTTNDNSVNWNNIKGKIQNEYSNITDEDFTFMHGNKSEALNRLQQKTGKTKAEVRQWVSSMSKVM
jgi:uncharacterized protein YjbJ (UPF0337 family)